MVGSIIIQKMVTFCNCCSSQIMTDKNLKFRRVVEKASKCWENELFQLISVINCHSEEGEN